MHISDGILDLPVLAAGFAGAGVLAVATMRNMDMEEIPKISIITSVFFVSSLIKVPVGPTSNILDFSRSTSSLEIFRSALLLCTTKRL